MKTIGTYQFTAIGGTSANTHTFHFPRIYKSAEQKILITVGSISYSATHDSPPDYTPHSFYLDGLGVITGKCNIERDSGSAMTTSNRWFLGTCGGYWSLTSQKNWSHTFSPPRLLLDELPLNEFTISSEHYTEVTENSRFLVSFNIDVVEV
jgi:hypothetical protein